MQELVYPPLPYKEALAGRAATIEDKVSVIVVKVGKIYVIEDTL